MQGTFKPGNNCKRALGERAFPDPYDAPAFGAERARNFPVTAAVAGNLVPPSSGIVARSKVAAAIMAVPETAIDKHGDFFFGENEVRFPNDLPVLSPASDMSGA